MSLQHFGLPPWKEPPVSQRRGAGSRRGSTERGERKQEGWGGPRVPTAKQQGKDCSCFLTPRAVESLTLVRHIHGTSPWAERTFWRQIQLLLLRRGRDFGKVKPGIIQVGRGVAICP